MTSRLQQAASAAQYPAPRARPARATPRGGQPLTVFRRRVTVALGIAIPLLSLSLAHVAGSLAALGLVGLALTAAGCGLSVLAVSLSHLADAIADITKAPPWQAWLLAATLDLSLVVCELCHVYAHDPALWWWTAAIMATVVAFSMALNVYAFLSDRRGHRKGR